ncbi:MAG: endonuclease I family protein [Gemmatimonadaceae bacterium]
MHRYAALGLALVLAACGGAGDGNQGPELPNLGTFEGAVAEGGTATATFVAGRNGEANVGVCGPEGVNFDVTVGTVTQSSSSNCERALFQATRGRTYTVTVRSIAGAGPFNGCWSTTFVTCSVAPPIVVIDDPGIPPGYYDSTTGLTGTLLLQALNDIIDDQRFLGYNTARDSLYAVVDDPDSDDIIVDLYTGRAAMVSTRQTAFIANFNTEHTWPRSRGADTVVFAGTDLHALFTSDETANSVRLNYPFGVVTGSVSWTSPPITGSAERSRLGTGAAGFTVFEPRDSKKGDVARAILYFHARYYFDRPPGFSLTNFNIEESALVQWSQQDPPDDFERARNNVVYRVQGNRNPFVDRPQFVQAVGDFPNSASH